MAEPRGEEPGRLARMERKLDALTESVVEWQLTTTKETEHRFTRLETTAKATARLAGSVAGFCGGLIGALASAWFSKHL